MAALQEISEKFVPEISEFEDLSELINFMNVLRYNYNDSQIKGSYKTSVLKKASSMGMERKEEL